MLKMVFKSLPFMEVQKLSGDRTCARVLGPIPWLARPGRYETLSMFNNSSTEHELLTAHK